MLHKTIFASEAMNGDELSIEIVSASKAALEEVEAFLRSANIRTRGELEAWINKQLFTLLESDGDIDRYDEYLLEV